jgi:putative nucleotidyltransferase with HDIG domain
MPALVPDAPAPRSRPAATRQELLAAALDPSHLPTPPAVALQVVAAAGRPDCDPADIVALLGRDPALCGKLLRAANSCVYGLRHPVASVARAVHVLGLRTVRSLALGLSLPAARGEAEAGEEVREFWIGSVGGAILARELAAHTGRADADADLAAGLLRDLGRPLLRAAFAGRWDAHLARHADRLVGDPCGAERASFGLDHADTGAELLRQWNLPPDIVEPIRHHHDPAALANGPKEHALRAELLHFADRLAQLDQIVQRPDLLARLLDTALEDWNFTRPALVEFLQRVAPKVEAFARVLDEDVGPRPDFSAILASGTAELVSLAVEANRPRPGAEASAPRVVPAPPQATAPATPALPPFRREFLDRLPASGCRLGEYELRSVLGRGAMGVVFKAYEPSLGRFVAVKALAPHLACDASRQRFAREARAAAAVQHENVVGVYAVCEQDGCAFLAMEYVEGTSLEAEVRGGRPLPVPRLVSVARQLAAGLGAAHDRQIVHRDLKPANVLVATDGRVLLTDFGLARGAGDTQLTAAGVRIGTPYYMAPEVIRGERATPLADLFGLGGVLYQAATGRVPFDGRTTAAVFQKACAEEPVLPSRLNPGLPVRLGEIILRLLEKEPQQRFPSAAALVAALAEVRAPKPR